LLLDFQSLLKKAVTSVISVFDLELRFARLSTHRRDSMIKMSRGLLVITAIVLGAASAPAEETTGVGGSDTQYRTRFETSVGDQKVNLVLTGTGLRKKVVFNVYTVGSYLQEGMNPRSAEELAGADCPKLMHLVMERDVGGKEMAEALVAGIRANYGAPAFKDELAALVDTMKGMEVKKGDHVMLWNIPKKGLYCDVVGKKQFRIENVDFSKAVWNIWLGRNNLGEELKKGLTSRL
jgi:hypothetical protein